MNSIDDDQGIGILHPILFVRRSARLHNQMAKHDGGSDELIDLTGGQADVVSDLVIQGIVAEIQAKHRKTVGNDRDVWKKESQKRSKYYIVAEKQCGDDVLGKKADRKRKLGLNNKKGKNQYAYHDARNCPFKRNGFRTIRDAENAEKDYPPFLRTARVLIDVHGEELVIRDGLERIVFKPDGSQDNESIHMMDVYDDRFKDVCEPESNNDSTNSVLVMRLGFARLVKCKIISQGRVIHSPKKASISAISHIFPNNNFEDSFTMGNENLNFVPNKELDKEILIPIPRESKIGIDLISFLNDESILKEETFKSYLNPLFEDDEEIISNEASSKISPKVDVKTIMSFFAPIGNCVRKWATSELKRDNAEEWIENKKKQKRSKTNRKRKKDKRVMSKSEKQPDITAGARPEQSRHGKKEVKSQITSQRVISGKCAKFQGFIWKIKDQGAKVAKEKNDLLKKKLEENNNKG
ncbi:hypothetical protein Tco_0974062 [Tanacetum coccineum]|uniref:Uncharacterized protein n=1 Tax=Tanacetum coccineum TaxID=301880 RepID=A0ABQ5EAJ5_9ASTR